MKTNRASDIRNLSFLSAFRFLLVFSTCHFQLGCSEHYESVQWTSQNPKFQFSKETIENGKAYYKLCVLLNKKLTVVCPNRSTYLRDVQKQIPISQQYESFWYVDKESFQACKVGSPKDKGINSVQLKCDDPTKLRYFVLVFQSVSAVNPLSFQPGTEHYFIATSDGSKDSLNNTSGGHCNDVGNGISMRMIIYVCYNDTDPECNRKTDPPPTSYSVNTNTTQKPGPATQAFRISSTDGIWHLLTIIFGVGFACSLVMLSICLFIVCHRKTGKKSMDEKDKLHRQVEENGLENVDTIADNCRV